MRLTPGPGCHLSPRVYLTAGCLTAEPLQVRSSYSTRCKSLERQRDRTCQSDVEQRERPLGHGVGGNHIKADLLLDLDEPVHRSVGGVIGGGLDPGYIDVAGESARGGQLRGGGQGPVGDQGEYHPLHDRMPTRSSGQMTQQGVDPE